MKPCQEEKNIVNQDSTLVLKYQLYGKDGVTPVTLSGADKLEFTLKDESSGNVIHGHGDPNPTDATTEVDGAGLWTHEFEALDNPIVNASSQEAVETHICTVKIHKEGGSDDFDLVDDIEMYVIKKPFAF